MTVTEVGISNRSCGIAIVATILGIVSIIAALQFTKGAGLLININALLITMGLFTLGGLAWMGAFEKSEPPAPPKEEAVTEAEFVPVTEYKEIKKPKEETWADKWMKENT